MFYLLHFICFIYYSKFISIPSFFSSSCRLVLALKVPQISVVLIASVLQLFARPPLKSIALTVLKTKSTLETAIAVRSVPAETLDGVGTATTSAAPRPTFIPLVELSTFLLSQPNTPPTSPKPSLAETLQAGSTVGVGRSLGA